MAIFDKAGQTIANLLKPSPAGFTGFVKGIGTGYGWGFKGGAPFVILGGAYAMATAPRGHALSQGAAAATGFGITSMIGGAIGGAIAGAPGAMVGSLAAQFFGAEAVDKAIAGAVQTAVDFGSKQRRLNMGGGYQDTEVAYTMRQVAAREMSGSLMNARQWLGSEAAFMHQ